MPWKGLAPQPEFYALITNQRFDTDDNESAMRHWGYFLLKLAVKYGARILWLGVSQANNVARTPKRKFIHSENAHRVSLLEDHNTGDWGARVDWKQVLLKA